MFVFGHFNFICEKLPILYINNQLSSVLLPSGKTFHETGLLSP